jgi:hypothetical protein
VCAISSKCSYRELLQKGYKMKKIIAALWGVQALSVVVVVVWYMFPQDSDQGRGIYPEETARSVVALIWLVGPYVFMRGLTAAAPLDGEGQRSRSTTDYDSRRFS